MSFASGSTRRDPTRRQDGADEQKTRGGNARRDPLQASFGRIGLRLMGSVQFGDGVARSMDFMFISRLLIGLELMVDASAGGDVAVARRPRQPPPKSQAP